MAELLTAQELAVSLQAQYDADTTPSLQTAIDDAVDLVLEAMRRSALPDPAPPGLKAFVRGIAMRLFTNPTGEQSEPTDGGQVVHGIVQQITSGVQLSDRERQQARRFGAAVYSVAAPSGGDYSQVGV